MKMAPEQTAISIFPFTSPMPAITAKAGQFTCPPFFAFSTTQP